MTHEAAEVRLVKVLEWQRDELSKLIDEYRDRSEAAEARVKVLKAERDRALWLATSIDVHRYLMACTSGRLSGAEKTERHQSLSEAFCYVLTGVEGARGYKIQRAIHDATQELTNHLDRIGLSRDDTRPDYDAIAKKFFDGFKDIAARAAKEQS